MCELLVRVIDKINDDFYLNCMCSKRGDVISLQADGWGWGKEELANPDWRIIKFPGVAVSQFTQFTTLQVPDDPLHPSRTLLRRGVRFAYQAIVNTQWAIAHPAAVTTFQNYIADATRQNASITIPLNVVQALVTELPTMTLVKPLVSDPAVIGTTGSPNVIG